MNEEEVPPWPLPQIHWPRSIDPEVSSRLKHTQKVGSQIDREIAFSPGAVRPPRYTPTTASSPVAARIQPQPSLQRSSSAAKPKAQDPSLPLRLLSQLEPGHSQASYINWLEEGSYFCSLFFSYGARTQREPGAIWIRMIVPSSIAMAIDAKGSFLSFPPIASYAERCLYVQGRNHSYPPLLTRATIWLADSEFSDLVLPWQYIAAKLGLAKPRRAPKHGCSHRYSYILIGIHPLHFIQSREILHPKERDHFRLL